MQSHNKHLEAQWSSRNAKPFVEYTHGSHFKGWWTCPVCQHEWKASIANRNQNNSGCPNCRKVSRRGNNNSRWSGHGELGGKQWKQMEREAIRRNQKFTITIEYAWQLYLLQERKCKLTGYSIVMCSMQDGIQIGNATLDRIDCSGGYVENNVQWIDRTVQAMKGDLNHETFVDICEDVAAYQVMKSTVVEESPLPPSFMEWTQKN